MKNAFDENCFEYVDEHFSNLDFSERPVNSVDFADCVFKNCSFEKTRFENCRFSNCKFLRSNLSLVEFPECGFDAVLFKESKLVGADFCESSLRKSKKKKGCGLIFSDCLLKYSIFTGLYINGIIFDGCVLTEVFFEEADLTEAVFNNSDLKNSKFNQTVLKKADFATARNYDVDLKNNRTEKAKFALPEAISLLYSTDIVLE